MSFLQKTMTGAKIAHFKNTENCPCAAMPIPAEVCISMSQHMGPPCKATVAKGDQVKVGTVVGDSDAFLSAPIHSSVSGTVSDVTELVTSNGSRTQVVIIKTDGEQAMDESVAPPKVSSHPEFVQAIKASGLVGLGGAGFPTHIKMNPKNLSEIDVLVVNAAECEPYITSDYRTIIERADDVLAGIAAIKKYVGISQVKIAVENNKPQAIELLRRMTEQDASVEVCALRSLYPKGAEKVAIFETTGRVVPEGKLPSDVGVIVNNITSTAFIGQYLRTGVPLVSKCLTVDGGAIAEPKNVIAPIGAHYADVIAFCGGYKRLAKKLVMGGPMMGILVFDDAYPVLKNNNALLALDESQVAVEEEQSCIRCGRCMQACPYNLMPRQIEIAAENDDIDLLNRLKVMLCMECGCCTYVCPAKKGLTFSNKMAKQKVRAASAKK